MRAMMIAAVVLIAGAVHAQQDVTFSISVTIPAARVAEWRAMMDGDATTFPPLYSNQVTVVDGVTNTVQVVVSETNRQQAKRISSDVLARWWRRQLQAYRNRTMPTTAPDLITTE